MTARLYLPPGHAIAVGPTGTGKTYRIRRWAQIPRRVLYVAPDVEVDVWSGRRVVLFGDTELAGAAAWWREDRSGIAAVEAPPEQYGEAVAWIAETVLDQPGAGGVVIVDELEAALEHGVPPELTRLWWRARKAHIQLWAVAHRPLGIPRAATSSGAVIAWRTAEPRDLAWYRAAGLPPARIESLRQYEALVRSRDGELYAMDPHGRIDIPAER